MDIKRLEDRIVQLEFLSIDQGHLVSESLMYNCRMEIEEESNFHHSGNTKGWLLSLVSQIRIRFILEQHMK